MDLFKDDVFTDFGYSARNLYYPYPRYRILFTLVNAASS